VQERRGLSPELVELGLALARGLDDAQVARQMEISLRTVRARVGRLRAALGAQTRFETGYRFAMLMEEKGRHR
jgi:DNA-binding NarL/FixJ family response regulator